MSSIPAPVLADLIPRPARTLPAHTRDGRGFTARARAANGLRAATLVVGGAGFLALASQIAVPIPGTPVPVSLATGAVVLLGAGLGARLGAASALIYLIAGIAGAPIFAEQGAGWAFASFGYVIGYIPAAFIAGALARRGADRTVWKTAALAGAATLAAYAAGVPWLMGFLGVDLATGLSVGMLPFLAGDALKMLAAALVLPGAWKLVDRIRGAH